MRRENAKPYPRHCERSEAIHGAARREKERMDCFASLAMTTTARWLFENLNRYQTSRRPASVLAGKMPDVLLGVELKPDAADQVELGFEEIDVMLLVLHQLLE